MPVVVRTIDIEANGEGYLQGVSLVVDDPDLKNVLTLGFSGHERISQPFSLKILVTTPPGYAMAQLSALLGKSAQVVIEEGSREFDFIGIISNVEMRGSTKAGRFIYALEIVPPLWLLSRNRRCRVFLQMSISDILNQILQEGDVTYTISLNVSYPTWPSVTQYEESDLDFISRLMEQEGIYYFFTYADDGTPTMTIADTPSSHVDSQVTLTAGLMSSAPGVQGPVFYQGIPAASATVRDYSHLHPAAPYQETASYSGNTMSSGALQEYLGPQPTTQADATRYAQVFLQQISCRQQLCYATSTMFRVRSGYLITISEHESDTLNAPYLVEEVEHGVNTDGYHNRMVLIPQGQLPYCAPRSTPVPRIPGFLLGKVTAPAGAQGQDIDGAYKVQLMMAEAGVDRVMRMAQPYAGPNQGIHFPLPNDTEVLLLHVNGDPNRPIIAGALPNANNPSPVVDANKQQCVVKSAKGATLIFDDGDNTQQVALTTGTGHTMVFNDLTDSPQMSLTTKGSHQLMLDDTKETPTITLKTTGGHELKLEDVTDAPKATLLTSGGHTLVMDDTESAPKATWTTTGGHKFVMDDTESAPTASLATTGGHSLTMADTEATPSVKLATTGGHVLGLDDTEATPTASLTSGGGHKVTLDDTEGKGVISLKTTGGHGVTMDDTPEMGKIALASTGGHQVTLDDMAAAPGISIQTNGGQKLTLSDLPPSVAMSTSGTLTISATTSITFKVGDNSIVIDETGVTISAALVTIKAEADLVLQAGATGTLKSTAPLSIQSSANVAIKGLMVAIN